MGVIAAGCFRWDGPDLVLYGDDSGICAQSFAMWSVTLHIGHSCLYWHSPGGTIHAPLFHEMQKLLLFLRQGVEYGEIATIVEDIGDTGSRHANAHWALVWSTCTGYRTVLGQPAVARR